MLIRLPNFIHRVLATRKDEGFALVVTTLLLAIVLGLGITLTTFTISSRQTAKTVEDTFAAIQLAEAGVQKALYCLRATSGVNCGGGSNFGGAYIGETNVTVGSGKFTTVVSSGINTKTVSSTGTAATGRTRTVLVTASTIPPSDDVSFSYALQIGNGGAYLENNAVINGTAYANSDIECDNNALITGDAYVSLGGGKINNCEVTFHAHADKILNSDVNGDAYYKNDPADIDDTTVVGTKFPNSVTPDPMTLPEFNLQFWRDSAEAGGVITGNYTPIDNSQIGPIKITGDLIIENNIDVTVTGPIWVMGTLRVINNGTFTLHPSWGSGSTVILADDPANLATRGKIILDNNVGFYGSGQPTSHILVVATNSSMSDSSPALNLKNNVTGAIFYALNGVLRVYNNGGAKSLVGKRLYLDNNATVTYNTSEMSGLNFSGSPGGTWGIEEGTWRVAR